MATLLGGDRWNEEMTSLNDDWYAYQIEQERMNNPLDDDYIPEKYRDFDEQDMMWNRREE